MSNVHEHLYRPLKQHQPNNSYHHKNNGQNTDANEDDIAQVMRLNLGVPRAALTVFVTLLSLLLQTPLLRRNDGHRRDLPQGVTLHLVLLHVLLLPVREINVELVYQHSDVLMFLQGDVRSQGLKLSYHPRFSHLFIHNILFIFHPELQSNSLARLITPKTL